MNNGSFLWLIIFGIAAACFFVIAAIVAFRGFRDLQDLLQETRQNSAKRSRK